MRLFSTLRNLREDRRAFGKGAESRRRRPGEAGRPGGKTAARDRGSPADGTIAVDATVETVDYQGQAVRYFVRAGDRHLQAINMIDERPFAGRRARFPPSASARLRGAACQLIFGTNNRDETEKPSLLPEPPPRPVLDQARGVYMWDVDGKRYLDGSSGAMVCNIGHSNPRVLTAMRLADGEIDLRLPAAFRDRSRLKNLRQRPLRSRRRGWKGVLRFRRIGGGGKRHQAGAAIRRGSGAEIALESDLAVSQSYHGARSARWR
jgi:hypothetical protein